MSLSKPVYTLLGAYLEQLFNHPIRTKCVTSAVLAASASYTSQKIAGAKEINERGVVAFGLFGLIFGGTVPHYFYGALDRLFDYDMKFRALVVFLAERLTYAPFFQVLSLYVLARFEGKDHKYAVDNVQKLFWPMLKANWTFLSLPVFLNLNFVPPMLRVLTISLVSFFWVLFLAKKRASLAKAESGSSGSSGISRKDV